MEEYWKLFNDWGIKVRQSHFIVNSVRIYEFFGLEWRLLFWDTEFSEFWNSIEWEKKKGSYLYIFSANNLQLARSIFPLPVRGR